MVDHTEAGQYRAMQCAWSQGRALELSILQHIRGEKHLGMGSNPTKSLAAELSCHSRGH